MGARISSILRKAEEEGAKPSAPEEAAKLLKAAEEWELVKYLGEYPATVQKSAENKDPSVMTG